MRPACSALSAAVCSLHATIKRPDRSFGAERGTTEGRGVQDLPTVTLLVRDAGLRVKVHVPHMPVLIWRSVTGGRGHLPGCCTRKPWAEPGRWLRAGTGPQGSRHRLFAQLVAGSLSVTSGCFHNKSIILCVCNAFDPELKASAGGRDTPAIVLPGPKVPRATCSAGLTRAACNGQSCDLSQTARGCTCCHGRATRQELVTAVNPDQFVWLCDSGVT